jgi:HlyD family secretion protein
MKAVIRILLLALLGGAAVVARPYVFPEKALAVEVYRATRGEVRETVTSPSSGTIVSRRQAVVAAEATGRVARVLLDRGDRAAEGAPVVLLDERDAEVEVRAAEAALATRRTALEAAQLRLEKAEADHAANEPLFGRRLISEDQWRLQRTTRDTARADVESARCAVAEAEVAVERTRVALAKRRVAAPFSGMIRRKLVEAGEHVVVGQPVFEIYDDASLFVRAPIDEVDLPKIRPGLAVDVALEPFGDRLFPGVLRTIEPGVATAKELNRTGEVEVDLKEVPAPAADGSYPAGLGPIRVGMSADVEVVVRTRADSLRVPAFAVHKDDETRFLYLVLGGRIERRVVRIGLENWDHAEVLEGISLGDAVVVSLDLKDLAPGRAATIAKEVRRIEVE